MKLPNMKAILASAALYFGMKYMEAPISTTLISGLVLLVSYQTFTYFTQNRAKLYFQANERNNSIIQNCPSISNRKYQQPWLFQSSLAQLIAFQLFVGLKKHLTFRRETIMDPAGKVKGITLSWPQDARKKPIKREDVLFFILPGLTGGEVDSYIHQLIDGIADKGYNSVIYNYRLLNQELDFSNSGDEHVNLISDLRITFQAIRKIYPQYKHIVAIGHSYGANQIVNYLGKYCEEPIVEAAVSISNPYDMNVSAKFVKGTLYDWFLARLLAEKVKQLKTVFETAPKSWGIDMEKALHAQTLHEFDHNFTTRVYGYPTVDTYYRAFGSINQILRISVPLFCLSAHDDKITVEHALPRDEAKINPNIILMETDHGSHVVWLQGNNPFKMNCWFPTPAIEFLENYVTHLKK